KFDPISQREFFQLGAFFNNTTQPAMDGNQKDSPPVIVIPNAEDEKEWAKLQEVRAEAGRSMVVDEELVKDWWQKSEGAVDRPIDSANLSLWLPLHEKESELPKGGSWAENHPAGKRGIRFENGADLQAELVGQSQTEAPLSISFWLRTPDRLVGTTLFDQTTKAENGKLLGWRITTNTQGALTFQLHDGFGKSIKGLLPGEEALAPKEWSHVCVRYSGGLANSAVSILVNGVPRNLRNSTQQTIQPAQLSNSALKVAPSLPTGGMSDVRIYRRWLNDKEVMLLAHEFELRDLLDRRIAWSNLDEGERKLATAYHNQVINTEFRAAARRFAKSQTRRDFVYARSVTSLVSEERSESKPRAWILNRGEYDQRGEEVGPGVPDVLPQMGDEWPQNRLGLAKWLVQPDHPLTARVTVNRLWQSIFGTGLVETAEDFGATGTPPTHPELLDWLAAEFMASGWDVHHLIKLMATSATYRQSSRVTPEKLASDPANRFFSRGPRVRLDAEVLRDQALAVSGLLVPTVGGPSVKPYQPSGVWKPVAFAGSNTREYKQDAGDALYRRSLYTFWKKTSPPTSMAAFDAPTRESCIVRRERTNTPMQALVLMNDPQFVEAARHLAVKAMKVVDDDFYRAAWMMRTVFTRPADARDLDALKAAAAQFRAYFKSAPEEAQALVSIGESEVTDEFEIAEIATWTIIANIVMNRDDFISK
ncbi:MAG: DUF1553 domain-containing protein, partial [Verrucomicrobiota bacterium]